MTKEEVRKLREDEETGVLRLPKNQMFTDEIDQRNMYCLNWLIKYLVEKNLDNDYDEVDADTAENIKQKNPFIKSLVGKGTKKEPYKITTTFGEGEFFDASAIIKKERLATIKKFYCFNNSFNFAMALAKNGYDCQQLSGIAFISNKPFLHSVINFKMNGKNYVLDLNYNLIISYQLYLKLFSFEVLAKNNGKTINEDLDLIFSKVKGIEEAVSDYDLAFAYEETMNEIKNKYGITGTTAD